MRQKQGGWWVIHCITVDMLTAIQLVSNDNKESNTGPKGVDGNRYFTEESCDFPTSGSNNLLIGAFVTDLKKPDRSLFFLFTCCLPAEHTANGVFLSTPQVNRQQEPR